MALLAATSASTALSEADEFLVTMALHVPADNGAIEHGKGGKQGGRAVALVVVVVVPSLPFMGRPGWVRSSAWIWALLVDRQQDSVSRWIN